MFQQRESTKLKMQVSLPARELPYFIYFSSVALQARFFLRLCFNSAFYPFISSHIHPITEVTPHNKVSAVFIIS